MKRFSIVIFLILFSACAEKNTIESEKYIPTDVAPNSTSSYLEDAKAQLDFHEEIRGKVLSRMEKLDGQKT